MKYSILRSLILAYVSFLSGCFSLFDSGAEQIIDEYNVCWIDNRKSRSICKALNSNETGGEQIIPAYVYSVGYNSKFIVAKQHPCDSDTNWKIQTSVTNYYIIDLSERPYAGQSGIYGPLSLQQFEEKARELKLGDIDFDMNYSEKP